MDVMQPCLVWVDGGCYRFFESEIWSNEDRLKTIEIENSDIQQFDNFGSQEFDDSDILEFVPSNVHEFGDFDSPEFGASNDEKFDHCNDQKFDNTNNQKFDVSNNQELNDIEKEEIKIDTVYFKNVAECMHTFTFDKRFRKVVIGYSGSILKKLESDTKTRIQLPRYDEGDKAAIKGLCKEAVISARRKIDEIIKNYLQFGPAFHTRVPLNAKIESSSRPLDVKVESSSRPLDVKVKNSSGSLDDKVKTGSHPLNVKVKSSTSSLNAKVKTSSHPLDVKVESSTSSLVTRVNTSSCPLDVKVDSSSSSLNAKVKTSSHPLDVKVESSSGPLNGVMKTSSDQLNSQVDSYIGPLDVRYRNPSSNLPINMHNVLPNKRTFTHFISIPMTNENITTNFIKFKNLLLNSHACNFRGVREEIFRKPEKLHIGLGMLCLSSDRAIKAAAAALEECKEKIIKPIIEKMGTIKIKAQGFKSMAWNPSDVRVLYCEVLTKNNVLQKIADEIMKYFQCSGLMQKLYKRKLEVQMTVMNVKFDKKCPDEKFYAKKIQTDYKDYFFGEIDLSTICISERGAYDSDGYYATAAKIDIP